MGPAWDRRISASVSNCGCIPYRESFTRDTGFQAEFVVPGFASNHDIDEVIALADQCQYLIMAADDDRWSRGADWLTDRLSSQSTHAQVEIRPGGHEFPPAARDRAYAFLIAQLQAV